jgi:carnitine 3-dehydrogenase
MKHFMAQFGPCLQWPWTKLTDVPEFTDELVDLIAGQSDAQSGHYTIRELERIRDGNLVGFLRALKDRDWGAGKVLREHDARRRVALPDPAPAGAPMVMAQMQVLPSWIDYNGHMTESRYLFAASETSDAFLRFIGADLEYVKSGFSYYTAESHIMHTGEAKLGDRLSGALQVLAADEKRLHVFISIQKDGVDVATIEQMLLHVDMAAGRAVPAPAVILDRVMPIAASHVSLPRPAAAGRFTGQRK